MIRFYICTCILLLTAAFAWGKQIQTIDPEDRGLKPSYEYEEQRPYEVPSSFYITQTPFEAVPYEVIVQDAFDAVWHRLETGLDATGFTLNTANTKTGIITCALTTDTPADFIDLGVTTRTFDREEFIFPTAASASYKLPYVNKNGDYYKVWRATSLKCIATLQISKLGSAAAKVSVSINYIFTKETRYENTAFRKKAPATETVTVNFITNVPQKVNLGNAQQPVFVTPRSNGVLEERLLNAARATGP